MLPTQAEAILSLTLRRLTALEATKLQSEHSDLTHAIAGLDILMQNNTQVYDVIKSETLELRQKHAISRRSEIVTTVKATLNDIDLIANERYEIGRFSALYLRNNDQNRCIYLFLSLYYIVYLIDYLCF